MENDVIKCLNQFKNSVSSKRILKITKHIVRRPSRNFINKKYSLKLKAQRIFEIIHSLRDNELEATTEELGQNC